MNTRTQRFLVGLVAGGFVMLAGCSHKTPSTSATTEAPASSATPAKTAPTPAAPATSSGTSGQKSAPMNACGQSSGS
ncbi:MAG TPA: hypothetical protein VMV40_05280 [Acidiferrobacter sp.]|nr:hypothetical protein [Acidiferrobacter sp.]